MQWLLYFLRYMPCSTGQMLHFYALKQLKCWVLFNNIAIQFWNNEEANFFPECWKTFFIGFKILRHWDVIFLTQVWFILNIHFNTFSPNVWLICHSLCHYFKFKWVIPQLQCPCNLNVLTFYLRTRLPLGNNILLLHVFYFYF